MKSMNSFIAGLLIKYLVSLKSLRNEMKLLDEVFIDIMNIRRNSIVLR